MLLRAALKPRNILILAGGIVLMAGAASYAPEAGWIRIIVGAAGIFAYIAAVIATIRSRDFKREVELSEKLEEINRLNHDINEHYRRVARRLGKNLREKSVRVLRHKDQLLHYFSRYNDDPIKQRIMEQALKLVMAYLKLAASVADRARELSPRCFNELTARINANHRRLGTLKSYQAVLDLTKTIEMDEKLLMRMKEEKNSLETAGVRLDQIESNIVGFKHRILSNEISDTGYEEIENAINEATALDNALNEHRRYRRRSSLQ
jgi:hypothetical protein